MRPGPLVVQVLPHLQPGGVVEVARILEDGLPAHGFSMQTLALGPFLDDWGANGRRISPALARGLRELFRAFRRCHPEALLAHTIGAGMATLPLARLAGIPRRIQVVHGSRDSVGALKASLLRLLVRSGTVTDVIFVGKAASASFGSLAHGGHVRVITNGVRLPPASVMRVHDPRTFEVVMAGRLVESKAPDLAIAATLRTSSRIRLTICGDGPDRARLEQLAGGDARIRFMGTITRSELRQVLEQSDAFVFPSRVEGLPLVLIEAADAGAAILAGDRAFNREVLGEGALYVSTDSPLDWARALDQMAGDPELLVRLRHVSRERARRFDPDHMVKAYASLLRGR